MDWQAWEDERVNPPAGEPETLPVPSETELDAEWAAELEALDTLSAGDPNEGDAF